MRSAAELPAANRLLTLRVPPHHPRPNSNARHFHFPQSPRYERTITFIPPIRAPIHAYRPVRP